MKKTLFLLANLLICLQAVHGIFHEHHHKNDSSCYHSECSVSSEQLQANHSQILDNEHNCQLCQSGQSFNFIHFSNLPQKNTFKRLSRHYSSSFSKVFITISWQQFDQRGPPALS